MHMLESKSSYFPITSCIRKALEHCNSRIMRTMELLLRYGGKPKYHLRLPDILKIAVAHMCALFWQCQTDLLVGSNSVSKWGETGML
jgi:hypothetical protein